ncbi:hypothetical protein RIF29_17717 [Crotalaria pallida]|uniref:Glycosyltransferase N-terminal domain-containing protein n=1 Tax=Crotalaria pallida TaxID=3830 RepID=A0AAN9FIX6_CROPI
MAETTTTREKNGHIVMSPFMAHGHLIPFLELARQIHERTNFTITIATTPLNIQHLKSAISSSNNDDDIYLAELPFNSTQRGLPPNIENTEKLPLPDIIKLFHASASLEDPLHSLVSKITQQEGHPQLCIISDLPVWAVGPLQPTASSLKSSKRRAGKESGISADACIEWLHSKHRSSVLYISFGSQNTISASQMMALAEGLEESRKPFILT